MVLQINDEIIDDEEIINEFIRLKPHFEENIAQLSKKSMITLIDWAKENVIEVLKGF